MYKFNYAFIGLFLLIAHVSYSQEKPPDSVNLKPIEAVTDTTTVESDSLATQPEQTGDLSTLIKYVSSDSQSLDVVTQTIHLYRNAKITYGDIELSGDYIAIDFINESVLAKPGVDSTGKIIGHPVFKQGAAEYTTDSIRYNFKTKKAIIYNVITEQGEGFLLGDKVKKNQYDDLFIADGRFCPCETPVAGTYIKSKKIKVVPKKKILVGPAQLFIGDVPTPLFIPFGMFPSPKEKASGVRIPTYGEEQRRGFFLRNGGYYWAINDYIDLDVLGSIYSKGGVGTSITSTYKKRYRYNGNFNFSYEKIVSGDEEDSVALNTFWIRWSHTPQSRGTGRFSASVNAGTSSYNENVVQSVERNTTAQFSSNVTYSKTFNRTPINIAMSARHNQNVATGVVNMTFPDFSLNMSRINPFKKKGSNGSKWYEKINFSYRFNSTVQISNNRVSSATGFDVLNENPLNDSIIGFNFDNADLLLDRAKIGGKHIIPVSTTFKLFKYFTLSPSFNYEELWYPNKLDYFFDENANAVRIDTIRKFSRAYSYSGGVSLNTNVYGTYQFKEGKRVQAIRHTIRPSLSFSYSPDFSKEEFGFYKNVQTDTSGTERLISRFDRFVFGSPQAGESGAISLSISNNLEMKTIPKNDTTGKPVKVSLIDNFGLSTSYNLVADSFNLSNINLTLRTKLFNKKVNLATSATVDPYIYQLLEPITVNENGTKTVVQRRVNDFAWNNGGGLGQITSARLSLGTSLNPKSNKKNTGNNNDRDTGLNDELERQQESARPEDLGYINGDPGLYVDFDVPWDLRVTYTLNYSKRGFQDAVIAQGIRFNGNIKLTPKWDIGFSSGYDIEKKEFTQTRMDVTRDLNCWMMVFNWTPFGRFTSYAFTVRIKSALLKDLKYYKRKSFFDQ
ncbi:putative LPS assembly protein LptD [Fulvivirgaceae bacterium BMA12]|uniref:LPS assembly protein LptD n=1 Tax=Agaribacillus aureus TaxID=3051825 RepID=A0ABT8LFK8_9BACT|nr:putative LPS assembly protein LptD [Fulvivirgaceae bacterium BMA12]